MKSGKFISPATSFPSTQPRVWWRPARDPRPACPRPAPGSSPGGGWCDTTITWSYLAILFRLSLAVPGMASINQQPLLATKGRAKMPRRSVAELPSLFMLAPGAKRPCKSESGPRCSSPWPPAWSQTRRTAAPRSGCGWDRLWDCWTDLGEEAEVRGHAQAEGACIYKACGCQQVHDLCNNPDEFLNPWIE